MIYFRYKTAGIARYEDERHKLLASGIVAILFLYGSGCWLCRSKYPHDPAISTELKKNY